MQAYEPDRSLVGKARRRLVRLFRRRPAKAWTDARPRLSISFDDAPVSATTLGARILSARGARATSTQARTISMRRISPRPRRRIPSGSQPARRFSDRWRRRWRT